MKVIQGGLDQQPPAGVDSPRAALIADLDARLQQAVDLDARIAVLDDERAALEVQRIEADLEQARDADADSRPDRAAVGELLERRVSIERDLAALLGRPVGTAAGPDAEQVEVMRGAVKALDDWLNAPRVRSSRRVEMAVRVVLLAATLLALWGAWTWHPAVLALLVPVAAPLAMLLNRGDDTIWRRLGAKQHFERSGLEPPSNWDRDSVAARLAVLRPELETLERRQAEAEAARAALESAAEQAGAADDERSDDERYAELSMQQVEVEQMLRARLRRLGLPADVDALDDTARAGFARAARAARVHGDLRRTARERERLAAEAAELRDGVWRALNREGAMQGDSRASGEALQAGLQRLREQG